MTPHLSAEAFNATLALVGAVILVAALLSGAIERTRLPQVAVFLALGAAIGPAGLGLLDLTLDSPTLRVVATISLVLVLFTDALSLDIADARRHGTLALLMLGPGTLLSAVLIGVAGWGLLGLAPAAAAIVGAALASTDPVLLRGMLQGQPVSPAVRQALHLESGLNDVVLLPIVLVAMTFLLPGVAHDAAQWGKLLVDLFVLGPGIGVAVGLVAVAALDLVQRRVGVRRDYESLYSLGVAFAAYAAAESVHGSGFLAAFAAGLTIAALDVDLCDCFLEYGQTTAEMALLFTFVLFGTSLIWNGLGALDLPLLLFAIIAILVRPVAYLLALARTNLPRRDRLLIAWYGPRGLSSLLLVLLPVFAGVPGSDRLFTICTVVVLLSIVLHGGQPVLTARRRARAAAVAAVPGPAEDSVPVPAEAGAAVGDRETPLAAPDGDPGDGRDGTAWQPADSLRITTDEVLALEQHGAPVVALDVRTARMYERDARQVQGAIRLAPEGDAARQAAALGLARQAWLVAYCT
jgi:NhaP-type Na+/H+ or K+/H+ antiporter